MLYYRFYRVILLYYDTFQLSYAFLQLHGFTRIFWRHSTPSRCGSHGRVRGGPSVWRVGGGAENTCFFRLSQLFLARMFQTCFSPSGNMPADAESRGRNFILTHKLQTRLANTSNLAPDCQNTAFRQNRDVQNLFFRHRSNNFKSDTGSLESVYGLIIPHTDLPL